MVSTLLATVTVFCTSVEFCVYGTQKTSANKTRQLHPIASLSDYLGYGNLDRKAQLCERKVCPLIVQSQMQTRCNEKQRKEDPLWLLHVHATGHFHCNRLTQLKLHLYNGYHSQGWCLTPNPSSINFELGGNVFVLVWHCHTGTNRYISSHTCAPLSKGSMCSHQCTLRLFPREWHMKH